jgi:hypothetical protein
MKANPMRKIGRPRKLSKIEWDALCRLLKKREYLRKQLERLTLTQLSKTFGVDRNTIIKYNQRRAEHD